MGFKMKGPDSMGFLNMNRNKRSLALNLKSPAGRDLLLDMAETADIVVENYRPGVMARLGLGYEAMRARNPRPDLRQHLGLRADRPLGQAPGLRPHGAGDVRA